MTTRGAAWFPHPMDPDQELYWDGNQWNGLARKAQPGEEIARTPTDAVTLSPSERRVPFGLSGRPMEASHPITVAPDSEEALRANKPFDPRVPPGPDELVPADCVWAFTPPPTSMKGSPYGSVNAIFVGLGQLRGRTFAEIVKYAGPPIASASRIRIWGKTSLFTGTYQISLTFDAYDIVAKLNSEIRA